MTKQERHYQHRRPNPQKPAVAADGRIWWARVIDLNGQYHCKINWSHADALAKAYELAAMVEKQRFIAALGPQS